jgi:hypothetical protein
MSDEEISSSDHWQQRVNAKLGSEEAPVKFLIGPIFLAYRLAVRFSRIAIGGAIGFFVGLGFNKAEEMLSKPFGTLSPIELLFGLGLGFLCLCGVAVALGVAFGEGETRQEYEKRLNAKRRSEIENALITEDYAAEHALENIRIVKNNIPYSVGRLIGRLKFIVRQHK